MALFAHSRPGTAASFWRNHNVLQERMIGACTSAARRPKVRTPIAPTPVTATPYPSWLPTPEQRARYQARNAAVRHAQANH